MRPTQAQQLAAVHAQQAAQAREELEDVRQKALEGIRSSGLSTEQLRELEQLRERVVLAEQDVSAKDAELLRWTSGAADRSGPSREAWVSFFHSFLIIALVARRIAICKSVEATMSWLPFLRLNIRSLVGAGCVGFVPRF